MERNLINTAAYTYFLKEEIMKQEVLTAMAAYHTVISLLCLMLFSVSLVFAQASPITFHLENVLSTSTTGPWMFENDDIGLNGFPFDKIGGDDNCYTFTPGLVTENYAYRYFLSDEMTSSSCLAENLPFVENTNGFRVEFDEFELTGFHKINTENGGMGWNVGGSAGDIREYTGGVGRIYKDNVLVLTVRECKLDVRTPYPTAAQMRSMFQTFYGVAVPWQQEVGTGEAVTAAGHGVIDDDPAFSHPQWVAAFANENGNQVDFELSTIDYVIQGLTGRYDFNLGIKAAAVEQNCLVQNVNLLNPDLHSFDLLNIQLDFELAEGGGPDEALNHITVNQNHAAPTNNLPFMVQRTLPHYWGISTDLSSFRTDLIFDLTGANLGAPESWIVMRRPANSEWWIMYGNTTIIDANTIRANDVTEFSDWSIGSIEDIPLPIELSSFSASMNSEGLAVINWITQTETGLCGYRVHRANSTIFAEALALNSELITANNSSSASIYTFTDTHNLEYGEWFYWLEAYEMSGTSVLYGPVSVTLTDSYGSDTPDTPVINTMMLKNYPNPFNPSTAISFFLPKATEAELFIYNTRGEEVMHYPSKTYPAEWNRLSWNGKDKMGRGLASGIYMLRLKTDSEVITHKMTLTK